MIIIGLKNGLIIGLIFGLFRMGGIAIVQHLLLRLIIFRDTYLPWKIISFLEYATDLIFLRRVGGSYIFIHRTLMEHFAEIELETIESSV